MRMNAGILSALVAGIVSLACGVLSDNIKGSGNVMTQQMPISGFTKVEAGNSFKITITRADKFNVTVKTDDNLVEHLDVKKLGDTLVIRLKHGTSARNATLEAGVSVPELTGIKLTGAAQGIVRGFGPMRVTPPGHPFDKLSNCLECQEFPRTN